MRSLVLTTVILLAACQDSQREITDIQAMQIADFHIAKHYPEYARARELLQPVAHDQGDTWLVTYQAPEGSAGGTPAIGIDKRSSRVVYVRAEQ